MSIDGSFIFGRNFEFGLSLGGRTRRCLEIHVDMICYFYSFYITLFEDPARSTNSSGRSTQGSTLGSTRADGRPITSRKTTTGTATTGGGEGATICIEGQRKLYHSGCSAIGSIGHLYLGIYVQGAPAGFTTVKAVYFDLALRTHFHCITGLLS